MTNHTINDPITILSSEKRIIENCSVEINAPINVYGKLVFRNCSITCTVGRIYVYGILKIEKCNTCVVPEFLHIMSGGEYLMDLGTFNDGKLFCEKGWSMEDGGKFAWIPYYVPVEKRFDDTIIACVSKYYDLDKNFTDYRIYEVEGDISDIERQNWDKARKMGTYLRKRLLDISWHQVMVSYYTYWPQRTFGQIEELIKNGEKELLLNLVEIMEEIIKGLYKIAIEDEKMYPFKD